MNNNTCGYTLGRFRSEVFKALDEYSCNGKEQEIFSGGTGDIDKRFICALNSAIRLVYLASARRPVQAHIRLVRPEVIQNIGNFTLQKGEETELLIGENMPFSFWFCGKGKVQVYIPREIRLECEAQIESEYGVLECYKSSARGYEIRLRIVAESRLEIKDMRIYSPSCSAEDEKYLPDGKNVYCAISPLCTEICSVTKHEGARRINCPTDIFTLCGDTLCCEEKNCGEYTVEYYRYPEEFSENDTPEKTVDLPHAACMAAVYAAAAELCAREDGELYARLMYKYREILANVYPAKNLTRKNSFFAGGIFGRRRSSGSFWG
ncbi:MAG: hypothetical protein IKV97_04945 [Clostridia bacterium]|nr:hypothetical protein [Clostridia bacterium]